MPRDGLSQYAPPPGTNGITNYTIESTKYNGFVADVTQDLNLPRPIVAGGTGANNAYDAMIALKGEIANQGPVTNYDTFPFVPGTFISNPGATAGPPSGGTTTDYFKGIVYGVPGNSLTIDCEALNLPHARYSRTMVSGVWEAWRQRAGSIADLDAAYVNVAGDTMSGPLVLPTDPTLPLQSATKQYVDNTTVSLTGDTMTGSLSIASGVIAVAAKGSAFGGPTGTSGRAAVTLADANIVLYNGGANNWAGIGSDGGGEMWFKTGLSGTPIPPLIIKNDLGVAVQTATASSSPTTGALTVAGGVGVSGAMNVASNARFGAASAAGTIYLGSGAANLSFDGTNYAFSAGALTVNGNLAVTGTSTHTGAAAFSSTINAAGDITSAARVVSTAGYFTAYNVGGGVQPTVGLHSAVLNGGMAASADGRLSFGGVAVSGGPNSRWMSVDTSGNFEVVLKGYQPGGGTWAATSDERIKNVLGDYGNGLDAIKTLQPVRFTYKGNDTPSDVKPSNHEMPRQSEDGKMLADDEGPVAVPYANSPHKRVAIANREFIGLIAQACEVAFPEMVKKVSGTIDGQPVTDLRELDTTPLIFALVNAVKELAARVEQLEAT